MKCTRCKDGLYANSVYVESGPHIKEICKLCKTFIKFAKKEDVPVQNLPKKKKISLF